MFYATLCDSHPLASVQNFTAIVAGETVRRGLNAKWVVKYSDARYVDVYISEMVQDTASGTINN